MGHIGIGTVDIRIHGIQVNNSTETANDELCMTNDLTKVQWFRNFDMNNNKITELATPTATTDAANKAYVDAHPGTGGTVTSVSGTGSVSGLTLTGTVTTSGNLTLGGAITGFTPLNDIRSLGVTAFTNGANPNITTAQVMAEIEADGGFDSFSSVFKTSWSYAGNYNLTDAGDFTETAGSSWITWTDNSSDSTRGNITALAIAPTTGSSAGGVFIYNDQGSGYNPGWRQVWTNTTDGAGSGLDADLLDGQQGSYYASAASLGNYLPLAGGTMTGPLVNRRINMNRSAGAGGQLWYSSSYTSWQNYMNPGGGGAGYGANITAPTGTYVTSWALRSFIENAGGYGWTWEGGSASTSTPSIVAELSSSSGNFKTIGNIYASGGNSTQWNTHTSNTGTISSINATTNGGALGTSNTLTGNGTMTLAWQGNTASYVRGDGSLATFPTIPQGDVTGITVSNGITGSSLTGPVPSISMSGSYSGSMQFSGAHGTSQVGCQLPAANNGAGTGVVNLRMWCSEPGVTWDWAGFGYNVTNNSTFGRLNSSFGQAYQRYSNSGVMYFYNTNTSGTRVTTLTLNNNGQAIFGYQVTAPTFVGALTGNAATVTNGVYTVGTQSIGGAKTFTTTPISVTRATADSSTYLATTAFVKNQGYTSNSGTVTSIATTNGITGGTITSTGTLQVDSTVLRTSGNQTRTGNLQINGGITFPTSAGGTLTRGQSYAIYQEQGGWSSPFPDLCIGFHTGISMGANASYNGMRFFNDSTLATQVMSINNASDGLGANNVYINNGLQVNGGNIVLGGISGRIQGVVSVLSGTDATSKTYVDGAISTAGNAFLPKAGGVMSGKIGRSSAIVGFLEGSYNNVGDNATNSNPIYTIGSSYNPASTTLSNMYGIGYTNAAASSFVSLTGAAGWGMYVAADGDARIFLDGSNGRISASGTIYAPNATITTVTGNLTGTASNATLAANSTLAGGLAIESGQTNNGVNKIVRTSVNGYVNFGWINSVSGATTSTITRITASNDAYLRYVTPATFRSQVIAPYFAPSSTVSGVTSIATTSPILGGTITGAGTLSLKVPVSGAWHNGGVAIVGAVTEVGRYIDFHTSNTGTSDYDIRLDANGSELNCSGNIRSQGNLEAVGNIVAGRAKFTSGTAALPSFSFTSDPDTGLSNPAANTIQLSTGGSYRWSVNNSATVIYQNVGIGVTPLAKFHVNGTSLVRTSTGVGDFYLGNVGTANHFRFHTNNSNTYFDMNCGNIYWRQGSSSRYTFFPSTANMTVNGTITQNSDIRIKENVVEIGDCISKVQAMRGVYYNRTDFNTKVTKVGVIAQEVEAVLPELILESPEDGFKSVAYSELTAVLINAIKEQQEIIEDLKTRITKLEK